MMECTTLVNCGTNYDDGLERNDDEEQGADDEEVQPLMEKELEALATVSQANRTLIQARQAVKDARATWQPVPRRSAAASAPQRDCPDPVLFGEVS